MTRNSNEELNKCDEKWCKKIDKLSEECAKIHMDLN